MTGDSGDTMSRITAPSTFYVVHDNMRSHYGLPVFMSPDYAAARHCFTHYEPDWQDAYYSGDPMVQLYQYTWEVSGQLELRLLDQRVR